MTIAQTIYRNNARWYPCPHCLKDHPSTTTVLDVIGSGALMGWAQKMGTKKLKILDKHFKNIFTDQDDKLLYMKAHEGAEKEWANEGETSDFWKNGAESAKEAADFGTVAHAAFEMWLQGKEVDVNALPGPSRNAFSVFRVFAQENKLETFATEKTFYNCKFGTAGTADWLGKINGKLTLADHKTSTGIFEKNIVQSWCNAIADEMSNSQNLYEQVGIWRFGKDGSTDILFATRNGQITMNGKIVQHSGHFGSYEQSRVLVQAATAWFHYKEEWTKNFPWIPKKSEKKTSVIS